MSTTADDFIAPRSHVLVLPFFLLPFFANTIAVQYIDLCYYTVPVLSTAVEEAVAAVADCANSASIQWPLSSLPAQSALHSTYVHDPASAFYHQGARGSFCTGCLACPLPSSLSAPHFAHPSSFSLLALSFLLASHSPGGGGGGQQSQDGGYSQKNAPGGLVIIRQRALVYLSEAYE